MLFLMEWLRFALATDTNDLRPWGQTCSNKLTSLLFFDFFIPTAPPPPFLDDYGMLMMAEALLEECLQENMDLLRSSTPLLDKTQAKLKRAKGHLNAILSRGYLTVSIIWVSSGSSHSCRILSVSS